MQQSSPFSAQKSKKILAPQWGGDHWVHGSEPDRDRSSNFVKRFFTYYCDSNSQPRIKRENPRRRFGLSEYFLFVNIIKSAIQCSKR